jgi:hypothetical protein
MAVASTRGLLGCGIVAGPLFVGVTAVEALTRDGFDIRRHGISLLALGGSGWIQGSASVGCSAAASRPRWCGGTARG